MPSLPRNVDWSIPRPSGFRVDTSKYTPFPTIKRVALAIHNQVRHFFPTKDSYPVETSPTPRELQRRPLPDPNSRTPVPYLNPHWPRNAPVRGNPTILDTPGLFRDKT